MEKGKYHKTDDNSHRAKCFAREQLIYDAEYEELHSYVMSQKILTINCVSFTCETIYHGLILSQIQDQE